MKELEDTNCEVRRIVDLHSSIWERLSAASEDEQSPGNGPNDAFESVKPLGGFLDGTNHAWLSYGNHLIVLNAKTGESVSSWNFKYRITAVSPFPTLAGQLPLLLIGLDNDAHKIKDSIGMICIFNCTTSRILRVIRVPCGVEQICVISGGSEWEELCDQRIATIFGNNSGIACVALRNFDYLIIDLQRSSWDSVSPYLVTDELSPYEIELPNSKGASSSSRRSCNREKHTAYSLINSRIENYLGFNRETFGLMSLPVEKLTTSLINSKKIGCLVAGCLGRVILWQSDGSIGWISPQFEANMSVSHLALIEPADDPRSFYYLWITCEDDSGVAAPVLRMYAMLFVKKSSEETGFILESDPSLKFEIELDEGDRISCLLPVERENTMDQSDSGSRRGEESLLLIGTNNRMLLFDLNQWYKEQMPLTASECSNQNCILASYRTGNEMPTTVRDLIVSTIYVPSSIKEFVNKGPSAMEELFFPNSLSFEWIELTASRITFWLTRGVQADLLRKIVITGPVTLIQPADTFHRCIAAGLVPFNVECSFSSDHNAQREMLLSLCLEQGWANFLVKCAKEWSDGSASYLFPAFLRWGVQRGTAIKIYADQLSVPLFDHSGMKIGESEAKILRFCCQQLECLSNVVTKLNVDSVDFVMQQRALKRVANYFQVLLWFYDVGLLPESPEVDDSNLSVPYPYQRLTELYREKREKLSAKRNNKQEDNLFIDNLINRECPSLREQWEKEGSDVGSVGQYPPPSLQSLLRSYLADCHEDEAVDLENKHQITYYFLLDLAIVLNDSCTSKNQLIKYPAAFKLSPSLIKLVQAFWLLDHADYQGFIDMITGQSVLESDIKDWHHQLVIKSLVHDNQHKLALMYLRVRKPPLMTLEEQGTVISLSVEYGLVQSAFHCRPSSHYSQLLMRFFRACKTYGKLPEILHLALNKEEEDAFVRFLEEDKSEETKLLYYLQRSRHPEASSVSSSSRFGLPLHQPVSLNMFQAYNGTLPSITRRFTSNQIRKTVDVDPDVRYPRPMSHARSYSRAQDIYDTVVRKAKETFNRGERTQVPFVSAPCMSLRTHPPSNDVNCVLFMEKKKHPVKRTIHQMQGSQDESSGTKRIKLSEDRTDGRKSDVPIARDSNRKNPRDKIRNKSFGEKSGLGIEALFSTPLVVRKAVFTNPISTPLETPHSILKIRQLIRQSGSPNLSTTSDVTEPISEKKPRQIRFSVSQIHDDSFQSESSEKQGEKTLIDDSKEVIDEEPSEVSEDHFFSPNVSVRSEESSVLSDTSLNYTGPRPRPGLQRRSANLSSNESLSRRTWSKTASTSSMPGTPTSHSISSKELSPANSVDFNRGKSPRNPLLTSIYSSSVLSDSSYEENIRKFDKEWDAEKSYSEPDYSSTEKTTRVTKSMSLTCVVKTVVEEIEIDNQEIEILDQEHVTKEISAEMCEKSNVEDEGRNNAQEIDDQARKECQFSNRMSREIDTTIEINTDDEEEDVQNEKSTRETEVNGEVHLEEKLDDKVSGIHEDTNRNILPDVDHHSLTEKELEADSLDEVEMLPLRDEEEEDEVDEADEVDEVFESLSNSISSDVAHSLTAEKSGLKKQSFEDDNITDDDESSEVLDRSSTIEKTIQNDEKYEMNITDDESDKINKQEFKSKKSKEISKSDSDYFSNCNNASIATNPTDEILVNQEEGEKVSKRRLSLRNTPVRETRARRASSIAKENVAVEIDSSVQAGSSEIQEVSVKKSRISREKTPVREMRSQRTSKDLASQENVEKSSSILDIQISSDLAEDVPKRKNTTRAQKTPAAKKDSLLNSKTVTDESVLEIQEISPELKDKVAKGREKTPVRETRTQKSRKDSLASQESLVLEESATTPRRSRRASSVSKIMDKAESLPEEVEKKVVRCRTPLRETRRSSLALHEESQPEELESDKRRTRRGGSLVKEVLSSTVELGNKRGARKVSLEPEVSVEVAPKRGRPKKVQEVPSQETEKEPEEAPRSVRRNTRRAASMQKELTSMEEVGDKAQESVVELDTTETTKKNTRSRRGNSVTKEIPLSRSTRATSLSKEIVEEPAEISVRQTRRRGNSVPKEISLAPSKTKRSANISEKIIEEVPDEIEESRTNESLENKILTEEVSIPVPRKRTRCPSVQSIPEEVEEILNVPTRSKSLRAAEKRENLPRWRRATSVDLPVEPKRYTRSSRLKESVILEESRGEVEEIRSDSQIVRQPSRRKRAASETATTVAEKEDVEVKTTREKPRRGRKVSEKCDDASDEFAFSLPENTSEPKDKKGLNQVHNFVFSPPQTRSKQTSQSRRYKSFIPTLSEEEIEEGKLLDAASGKKPAENEDKKIRNPNYRFVPSSLNKRKTFTLSEPKKQEK